MHRALQIVMAALLCALLAPVFNSAAAAPAVPSMFQAEVMFQRAKKAPQPCGRALACDGYARLDVHTLKAGAFTIIVDGNASRMQVASHALKAYVEIPLQESPGDWRSILRSAAAYVFPQSFGMMNIHEAYRKSKGVEQLRGYAVHHAVTGFDALFMGITHSFEIETWENDAFFPFPLKATCAETKTTWGGSAYLSRITADNALDDAFVLPGDFSRYSSITDLIIYAIAAF